MNQALEIINEVTEKPEFKIDSDERAEWAIKKIKEEQAEAQRLIDVCMDQLYFYEGKLDQARKALESKTGNLKTMLFEYFMTVERKTTKTQETYSLPSGKLKLKYPKPEYKRDDATLLSWLQQRGMAEYIKVSVSPQWGELKKTVQVAGDKACVDGEIIDGIQIVEKAPVFEVEV